MAKIAKIASKNSPTQRGKVVSANYNGKPVTKIFLHSRNNGRKNISSCVAYKEVAAAMGSNLLIKKDNKEYLYWKDLSN